MATLKKYGGFFSRMKNSIQKAAVVILIFVAFTMMLVGKADIFIVEKGRQLVLDVSTPLVRLISYPSQALSYIIDNINEFANLRVENRLLHEENRTLVEWRNYAQKLEGDLERIARVVNYVPPPESKFITAKVIADAGTPLSQTVIAFAGEQNGVRKGLVVMTNDGLVGRVLSVGNSTSRILLLTDVSSRLPVVIGERKIRAMLVGNNTESPQVMFLPIDAEVKVGDKILTSGISGVFPPDLTVGVVSHINEDGEVFAQLAVDRNLLSFIKIVDFGLEGILPENNCEAGK